MPAGRGIAPLADVPDGACRHRPSELVIGRKNPVVAMPVLPRRRDEIGEPVEELKRREFDDAIGSRPRGLPPTTPPDPVGRHVPVLARLRVLLPPRRPAGVTDVIRRLMAKEPNARFQSAAALAARLDALAGGAVALDEDGGFVAFDVPAGSQGSVGYHPGYLTGMHPMPAPATGRHAAVTETLLGASLVLKALAR